MDEYSILRKKQKKNAFAATALLISIAIALLVMVGAVLILSKVNDNDRVTPYESGNTTETSNEGNSSNNSTTCEGLVKEIVFNDNLKTIKEAAISYFTNERLPQDDDEKVKITLNEMINKRLVRTVHDASANTCDGNKSYVEVTKGNNEYIMKVFLSCSDIEDYVIVHLGCYDYCDKDVCEKKEEVVKEYEYEYKKTTSCVMSDWSNWGSWKTTREKTSNLKKEDIKVETTTSDKTETIDATANVSYNCDKYPGYTLEGTKCVKTTTVTETKDATPSNYSYSCSKYPGFSLVGTKCIKKTTVKETIDATQNPITYSCPKGYTLNGKKCERTVTKTDTVDATRKCPSGYSLNGTKCTKTTTETVDATRKCPSGYSLSGTKCKKTTTDVKDAEAIYDTRDKKEYYTCYKEECTTTTVFTCPAGKSCGNYPQTSCEKVKKTCSRIVKEQYISGYQCPSSKYVLSEKDGKHICTLTTTDTKDSTLTCPSSKYTLNGTKCTLTTTDTKDSTLTCPSNYNLDGTKCVKKYSEVEKIDATQDPITYSCPKGYTLSGKKCSRDVEITETKEPEKVPGGYVCPEGFTQNGKKCTKVTTTTDKKDATKKVTYSCPKGYTQNNKTCSITGTHTVKKTYYRYATRTCNGGSTSTKWSTSKNDSILKSEGYKLTGKKREITEIVK